MGTTTRRIGPRSVCGIIVLVVLTLAAGASAQSLTTVAYTGRAAPGTGESFQDFFGSSCINASGDTAFRVTLTDTAGLGLETPSLWTHAGGSLGLLARAGVTTAPGTGGALFAEFELSPVIGDSGVTVFRGSAGAYVGIWKGTPGNLEIVARGGDVAPGTGGARFFSFYRDDPPVINASGNTAFAAQLDVALGSGIWAERSGTLGPVAVTEQTAPGVLGETFTSFAMPVLNDDGDIAFSATDTSGVHGIWREISGLLGLVAHVDRSTGIAGDTFIELGGLDITESGNVAFTARSTLTEEALWRTSASGLGIIVKQNDPAPGTTGSFSSFGRPAANRLGHVAFYAWQVGHGQGDGPGIWREGPGGIQLVALAGQAPPGYGAGATFATFGEPVLNEAGHVSFMAGVRLPGGDEQALFAEDPSGVLRLIARPGDTVTVAPGVTRTIIWLETVFTWAGAQDGRYTTFNDSGQIAFSATTGSGFLAVASFGGTPPPPPLEVSLAGKGKLKLKKIAKEKVAASWSVNLADDGTWTCTDGNGDSYTGSWIQTDSKGRKFRLEYDALSLQGLLAALGQKAEDLGGVPVTTALRKDPKITVKLNKKRTSMKLKAKFSIEGTADGETKAQKGSYSLKLKGDVTSDD